jgi:hypothetical protein
MPGRVVICASGGHGFDRVILQTLVDEANRLASHKYDPYGVVCQRGFVTAELLAGRDVD